MLQVRAVSHEVSLGASGAVVLGFAVDREMCVRQAHVAQSLVSYCSEFLFQWDPALVSRVLVTVAVSARFCPEWERYGF